jgi:hypothetical protein
MLVKKAKGVLFKTMIIRKDMEPKSNDNCGFTANEQSKNVSAWRILAKLAQQEQDSC